MKKLVVLAVALFAFGTMISTSQAAGTCGAGKGACAVEKKEGCQKKEGCKKAEKKEGCKKGASAEGGCKKAK